MNFLFNIDFYRAERLCR